LTGNTNHRNRQRTMKIAIDAMGGDHAPEAVIEGTVLAESHCPADLVLVGDEQALRETLGRISAGRVPEIVHAPQAIGMD
jgi:phosphate acyltransferase